MLETLKMMFIRYMPGLNLFSVSIGVIDIVEILILSFLVYTVLVWIKNTRAWTLLKGIVLIILFGAMVYLFHMDTLIFIINRGFSLIVMAAVVIFQPELRKALEMLGEKMFLSNIFANNSEKDVVQRCSDKTVNELVRASIEMARAKTGALIVLEQNETLEEYERTGIDVDAMVSSQLLINIFEHNTPLHDGAVIIKGDRIVSATCYLPLSENLNLSKALGTRHRAGVGISEVTDSVTIIVSEETGRISIAQRGRLRQDVKEEELKACLVALQNKTPVTRKGLTGTVIWKKKGKRTDEA